MNYAEKIKEAYQRRRSPASPETEETWLAVYRIDGGLYFLVQELQLSYPHRRGEGYSWERGGFKDKKKADKAAGLYRILHRMQTVVVSKSEWAANKNMYHQTVRNVFEGKAFWEDAQSAEDILKFVQPLMPKEVADRMDEQLMLQYELGYKLVIDDEAA